MALDVEGIMLRNMIRQQHFYEEDFRRYDYGLIEDTPVVICVSGPGKVNAAMTTQNLLTRFHVTQLFHTGVSGSLGMCKVGDMIIGESAVYHDYGELSNTSLDRFPVTVKFPPSYQRERKSSFKSDYNLINLIVKTIEVVGLSSIPVLGLTKNNYYVGTIATGDQFIASYFHRNRIKKETEALAVDMESAAVAQICYLNETPFCILRTISDNADLPLNVDFLTYLEQTSYRSAKVIYNVISKLNIDDNKDTLILKSKLVVEKRSIVLKIDIGKEESAIIQEFTNKKIDSIDLTSIELIRLFANKDL